MHKLSETNWQYKNMGRHDKGFVCGPGLRLGAMGFAFNTSCLILLVNGWPKRNHLDKFDLEVV